MNKATRSSIDNLLMSILVGSGLLMATLGPAVSNPHTLAVMNSVSRTVQSVSAPAALPPVPYQDAAIIVTAPRLRTPI